MKNCERAVESLLIVFGKRTKKLEHKAKQCMQSSLTCNGVSPRLFFVHCHLLQPPPAEALLVTCLDIFHSSLRETVHYYYDDKLKQIIQNPMEMIVDAFSKLGKLNRTAA